MVKLPEDNALELYKTIYFNCRVIVWKSNSQHYSSIPWRFAIIDENKKRRDYYGIPNYVETKRKALKRAWWRAKWIQSGEYSKKYITF